MTKKINFYVNKWVYVDLFSVGPLQILFKIRFYIKKVAEYLLSFGANLSEHMLRIVDVEGLGDVPVIA